MAWCPHCNENRPIQRQVFKGQCEYCGRNEDFPHQTNCRGPLNGLLDVCAYCNTSVFAKASTELEYESSVMLENTIIDDLEPIINALFEGKKILAIKLYRKLTRVSLKDAKEYIDSLCIELQKNIQIIPSLV